MAWLFYVTGITLFAVYFALFQRAVGNLVPDERRRLIAEVRAPWLYYVALLGLIAVVTIASDVTARAAGKVVLVALTVWGQVDHQRRLEQLGFDVGYRKRLALIFPLSLAAVVLFMAATILFVAA
jgi:hypothetical protein